MGPINDGVIKYDRGRYEKSAPLKTDEFRDLEKWRDTLHKLKLIGEYLPEKIGYGNLSARKNYLSIHQTENPQFVISGTQTGGLESLDGETYTRVLDFDLKENWAQVNGPVEASSEALTHAAVYLSNPQIQCVFHIHSKPIWNGMIEENYPATAEEIPYGTTDMANEVQRLIQNKNSGILVMKGHEDGVISYGESFEDAGRLILEVYDKFGG